METGKNLKTRTKFKAGNLVDYDEFRRFFVKYIYMAFKRKLSFKFLIYQIDMPTFTHISQHHVS